MVSVPIAGVDPVEALARVGRRVQLRPRVRVLPTSVAHLPRVRDARAEPLRLPQAEQVLPAAAQVHQADIAAGAHGAAQIEGKSSVIFMINPLNVPSDPHGSLPE